MRRQNYIGFSALLLLLAGCNNKGPADKRIKQMDSVATAELARAVVKVAAQGSQFRHLYDVAWPIKKKIETIATTMYGAASVSYSPQAERDVELATRLGFDHLPICMAKTPLSLSHDPAVKGRPSGFAIPIQELRILAGAGFLTALCSGIQLMPGLPKKPAGERIDVDPQSGEIVGLA